VVKDTKTRNNLPVQTLTTLREPDTRYLAAPTLVDSCILIDVFSNDVKWAQWSIDQLVELGSQSPLVINPIILAEISARFERATDLEQALALLPIRKDPLPWDAAFLAGQAFRVYRRKTGQKRSPMPDFYIGAHALVGQMRLLTRDRTRYSTYFPKLEVISPKGAL
jgi:predicted nucleic acid-binding protein